MFCPNCGAPNPDTAVTCQKCGFNVKGAAAPKFKGTMLMMNQPGAPAVPGVTPPMPFGAPQPGMQQPGVAQPGAPAAGPAGGPGHAPAAPPEAIHSKLKGTMIGVAPPSAGAVAPPGQAPNFGQAGGAGPGRVNPLESTIAAGSAPMSPFAGAGYPGPQGAGQPGAAPQGYGNPTPAPGMHPGYGAGAPAGVSPAMGAPGGVGQPGLAGPGLPGPSPIGPSPTGPSPTGPSPTAPGPAYPQQGAPHGSGGYAQPGMPAGAQPYAPVVATGSPAALATSGGFEKRSAVGLFFLVMVTCGIYAFFWYADTSRVARSRGAEIPPLWHVFIPILNLIWMWKWCQGMEKATGGRLSAGTSLIMLLFLGAIGMGILQSKLNEL